MGKRGKRHHDPKFKKKCEWVKHGGKLVATATPPPPLSAQKLLKNRGGRLLIWAADENSVATKKGSKWTFGKCPQILSFGKRRFPKSRNAAREGGGTHPTLSPSPSTPGGDLICRRDQQSTPPPPRVAVDWASSNGKTIFLRSQLGESKAGVQLPHL